MLTDPTLDYARGFIPFLDCTIFLDSRPLIPRPETEYWTERAIDALRSVSAPHVLDLFAGSGAIGVVVLKHIPDSRVDFGEINISHFPTVRKNILENGLEENRARILQTDVWSSVSDTYDFILANPPYIAEDASDVDESVRANEPHEALFAGDNGFALIEKTITGARQHLAPEGFLYIEHRPEQADAIQKLAAKNGLAATSHNDQYGIVRFSILARASQ